MKFKYLLSLLLICQIASAKSDLFFSEEFKERDGAFTIINIENKRIIEQYNPKRLKVRTRPMSSFKLALLAMAFDSGYFKNNRQIIKWDGVKRNRKSLNRNQTPQSFMKNSVIWVSRLITNNLGEKKISDYLEDFQYGNKKITSTILCCNQGRNHKNSSSPVISEKNVFVRLNSSTKL